MYKLTNSTNIKRIADGAFIPADPQNTDYADYLAWVAEGNTPEPFDSIDSKQAIRDQIRQMEFEQIMPRAVREYMLLSMEAQFTPAQLDLNFGYRAVKAFDNQIKALRDQL